MAKNAIFNTVEEAIEDFREGRIVILSLIHILTLPTN